MGRIQLTLFQRLVLLTAAGAILFVLISQIDYHGFEELPGTWAVQVLIVAGLVVLAMWPKSPEEGTGFARGVRELGERFAARKNQSAASAEVAEPENRRQGYLARHWRGELSLPTSYWLNGVLLAVVLAPAIGVLGRWLPSTSASLPVLAWLWLALIAVLLCISMWSQVGIWRSAGQHPKRGGKPGCAFAARFLGVIGVLAALGSASSSLWPQLKEMAPLALGRDRLGPPADVSISPDGGAVVVSGPLAHGTFRKFADALAGRSNIKWVRLSSPGGCLLEARRLAAAVRERKLSTHAQGECSSACVMILVSGVERIAAAGTRIGLHQASMPGTPPSEISALETESREVYEEAGIASDFIDRALSTPNDMPWYPSAEELLSARVLTRIVIPPKPMPEPPLPLAHVVLPKGEELLHQNPDAYDVTYLKRRYRVLGNVSHISGLESGCHYLMGCSPGQVFKVDLEPWASDSYAVPTLEFTTFTKQWALALRPGARIAADCLMVERPVADIYYRFYNCTINTSQSGPAQLVRSGQRPAMGEPLLQRK